MSLQSTTEYDWRYILQHVTKSSGQLFNQEGGSKKCPFWNASPFNSHAPRDFSSRTPNKARGLKLDLKHAEGQRP